MPRTQLHCDQVANDILTGDDIKEETLLDTKIVFNDSEFVAQTIHDAIIEARIGTPAFSDLFGVLTQDVTIALNRAMIMVNPTIGDHEIKIKGELVIL